MKEERITTPLLEIRALSKHFGGLVALDGVDMAIYEGEIVGLIGPNGAGKTTLFSSIAGSLPPDSGRVFFQGKDITGLKAHTICRMGMGRTFQIPKPFSNLTVLENMMVGAWFGSGLGTGKEAISKAHDILNLSGLIDKASLPAASLNLPERKKLEIARALSTSPSLILFDEVMAGLNPTEISEMVGFVRKLKGKGLTILLIEHLMKVIMNLSDRVAVLHYGKKICEGSPKHVANDPKVIEAYLGLKADA